MKFTASKYWTRDTLLYEMAFGMYNWTQQTVPTSIADSSNECEPQYRSKVIPSLVEYFDNYRELRTTLERVNIVHLKKFEIEIEYFDEKYLFKNSKYHTKFLRHHSKNIVPRA